MLNTFLNAEREGLYKSIVLSSVHELDIKTKIFKIIAEQTIGG